ncbi:50S ribosomal protein L7/L12 [bacterium]|nr:50S ribosomal protein L7/L12 [bacterium]
MAKLTKEEIIDSLKEMTLVELNDLVKGIEETFGVTAAAPVVAAVGQAAAGAEPATVTVKVTGLTDPTKKVAVLKVYKEITGLGLMDAKKAIDALPAVVKEDIKKEEAADLKKKLEEAGAVVTVA